MDRGKWRRVNELFEQAIELPAEKRKPFLEGLRHMDPDMAREVESLLQFDDRANRRGFLGQLPRFDADPSLLGRKIGPYLLEEHIGAGGMGAVYRGKREDGKFHQTVAIKVLSRACETDQFRAECDTLSHLNHPGIARLFDGGKTSDGLSYLVMEFVDGQPIHAWCREHRLNRDQILELFLKVCSAVEHAHRNLVVHRDLKAGNILVDREGFPKLLDFGIARLLGVETEKTVVPRFTPECASPEQVRGDTVTTQTDVYSLGVLLYRLLTGELPYEFRTGYFEEWSQVICEKEPARTGLEPDLDRILRKALRKNPADRYASVQHLAEDIERFRRGMPVTATPPSLAYLGRKFIRRHRLGVLTAGLLAISIGAGLAGIFYQADIAREQRDRAQKLAVAEAQQKEIALASQLFHNWSNRLLKKTLAGKNLPDLNPRFSLNDPWMEASYGRVSTAQSPPLQRVARLTAMAKANRRAFENEKAADLFHQALPELEAITGPDHPAVAVLLNEMGITLVMAGRCQEARPFLERCLALRRIWLDAEDQAMARILGDFGSLATQNGDPILAESWRRLSLDILHKVLGPHDPGLAEARFYLGRTLVLQGKFQEAKSQITQAQKKIQELTESYPFLPVFRSEGPGFPLQEHNRRLRQLEKTAEIR